MFLKTVYSSLGIRQIPSVAGRGSGRGPEPGEAGSKPLWALVLPGAYEEAMGETRPGRALRLF